VTPPDVAPSRAALPWLALAAVALFLLLGTHDRVGGWNDASRLAMVEAIVEHGHLWVDGTHMSRFTGDVARIDGKFYSDKPPALALLAVPVYAAQVALGATFRKNLPETYYLTTLLTVGLTTLLGLVVLERFLRRFEPDPAWRAATVLALGLGTLNTAYSVTFSNHPPSAMALLGVFLLVWRRRRFGGGLVSVAAAGALAGVTALVDHAAVFYMPAFVVYLAWPGAERGVRGGVAFAAVAAVPLAGYAAYAYALTGSAVPLSLQREIFEYPGSYFAAQGRLTGTGMPHGSLGELAAYAWLCLFGDRGLFSHTPLALAVLAGMIKVAADRAHPRRAEVLVVLAPTGVLVLYYLLTSTDPGGNSVGVRWYCFFLPLLYVFLADAYRALGARAARALFWAAYVASFPPALIAALNPWVDLQRFGPGLSWVSVLRSRGFLGAPQ
jgi:hypothetical protein